MALLNVLFYIIINRTYCQWETECFEHELLPSLFANSPIRILLPTQALAGEERILPGLHRQLDDDLEAKRIRRELAGNRAPATKPITELIPVESAYWISGM